MRYLFILLLSLSSILFSDEIVYVEGDIFEADKYEAIALYFYKSDALKLKTARDFTFSLKDFINYAAIDQRDIYKIRKGDTFKITKSFRNGDIFQIDLESKRSKREKYFVLSEDLKNSFLTKITENS